MRYTPSILAITFLTLLLEPTTCLPFHHSQITRHKLPERAIPETRLEERGILEERGTLEERQSYGFGTPTHFADLGEPEERPNPCGTEGCIEESLVRPRALQERDEKLSKAIRKRAIQDGEFITNVEFSPE